MENYALRKIQVRFKRPKIKDIATAVREQFEGQKDLFKKGSSIAVAVGSRGISNLQEIVRASVESLKEFGVKPFIIPAMGSHGGATDKGQAETIASYGITEKEIGCSVRSSMDVVELPSEGLEHKLYMDRHAHESDGVVLINRVKRHTDFRGRYESGLVKMAVIGLGKEEQAAAIHRFGVIGLRDYIPKAAEQIFETGKVLAGLAIVENAYEDTAKLELIPCREIMQREPKLLKYSRDHMARLPVDELDVLIVDRMGKDISGSGLDTNVIGRLRIIGEEEFDSPRISAIMVDDLTEASHGNAIGMGLADVITYKLFDKIDWKATYRNLITSTFLERGKMPLIGRTAAEAFDHALRSCGGVKPEDAWVIRVKDTLHLAEIYGSSAVCDALKEREGIEISREEEQIFDQRGRLRPFE